MVEITESSQSAVLVRDDTDDCSLCRIRFLKSSSITACETLVLAFQLSFRNLDLKATRHSKSCRSYLSAGQRRLDRDTPLACQEEECVEGEERAEGHKCDLFRPDPLVVTEKVDEHPGRIQKEEGPDICVLNPG